MKREGRASMPDWEREIKRYLAAGQGSGAAGSAYPCLMRESQYTVLLLEGRKVMREMFRVIEVDCCQRKLDEV